VRGRGYSGFRSLQPSFPEPTSTPSSDPQPNRRHPSAPQPHPLHAPRNATPQVNHYHYTSWPDHGVPPTTAGVRALCHALDDCRRASCNIAVHCSAGVGRTGAFVAIDMLLQRLQRLRLQPPGAITGAAVTEAVDVQALVLALRGQRRGMVQTGAQYEFVYHALVDDLKEGIQAGQEMLLVEAEAEHLEAEQAAAATASGPRGLWARSRGKERSGGAGGGMLR